MNDLIYISISSLHWGKARPTLQADHAAPIQKRKEDGVREEYWAMK